MVTTSLSVALSSHRLMLLASLMVSAIRMKVSEAVSALMAPSTVLNIMVSFTILPATSTRVRYFKKATHSSGYWVFAATIKPWGAPVSAFWSPAAPSISGKSNQDRSNSAGSMYCTWLNCS